LYVGHYKSSFYFSLKRRRPSKGRHSRFHLPFWLLSYVYEGRPAAIQDRGDLTPLESSVQLLYAWLEIKRRNFTWVPPEKDPASGICTRFPAAAAPNNPLLQQEKKLYSPLCNRYT
jgi:hypothetical protein